MRHGDKINNLGRTKSHRTALLRNLSCQLIEYKRIITTQAKAKELRKFVEPLINRSKEDSTANRRLVFSRLNSKEAVKELFGTISDKIADRPGGYTRIIKLAPRMGDAADMALIELVDFNTLYTKEEKKKTTRRSRRSGTSKKAETTAATPEVKEAAATTENVAAAVEAGDDLTKIEGVGPKIAEVLHAAGIVTFADLTAKSAEEVKEILDAADGSFNLADPATWAQQAQLAADGKWDELQALQDELKGGKEVE